MTKDSFEARLAQGIASREQMLRELAEESKPIPRARFDEIVGAHENRLRALRLLGAKQ